MRPGRGLVCAAMVAAASSLGLSAQPRSAPSLGLSAIIAEARGLPADFGADALIRLSASSRITARNRRELLDEAFMRAYAAYDDHRRSTTASLQPESRQSAQRFAYDSGLTRLTLQTRATQLMTFSDPARARQLFDWIELNLEDGVCDDALVAAVDEYYSALSLIARTAFGSDRAEAVRFLELHLWRARLPNEMPAVARAVLRFRPRLDEAIYLEAVVRWILQRSARDPRGFSSASLDIVSRIADLQQADHGQGVPGWYLLDGLREYLLSQLTGPRCADSTTEQMVAPAFNGAVASLGAGWEVDRIDPSVVRSSKLLGAARFNYYWQTPDARRLYRDAAILRGDGRTNYPEAVRRTKDWGDQADLLITAIEQWSGRRELSERDYFYQKTMLFGGLVDLVPAGALRARATRALIEFLRHSETDRDRRALWFALMGRLLELARTDPTREIFAELEASQHPVLSVYSRIERTVAPRTAPAFDR